MKNQVLLLNLDNTPLHLITLRKAYRLLSKNKVWGDETDPECYEVMAIKQVIKIPKILILKYYVKLPYKKAAPTRQNVFKRDQYCCGYCGIELSTSSATLDHIVPRSKGGATSWTNMVTACKDCNTSKGNRTPKEAKMTLKIKAHEPSFGFLFESMLITFKRNSEKT